MVEVLKGASCNAWSETICTYGVPEAREEVATRTDIRIGSNNFWSAQVIQNFSSLVESTETTIAMPLPYRRT